MSTTSSVGGERRRRVLEDLIEQDGSLRLTDAARRLGVSEMTVRRDLADLEVAGVLRRVRGGATRASGPRPFLDRSLRRRSAKAKIAEKALTELPREGAFAVDASTTAGALAELLADAADLIAITNSWENFGALRRAGVREAVLTGGEADGVTGSLVGPVACRAATAMSYEVLFASASGIDAAVGGSDVSLREAQVKSEFARCAERVVLLADSSKLGRRDLARSFKWSEISLLITELDPGDELLEPYRNLVELR